MTGRRTWARAPFAAIFFMLLEACSNTSGASLQTPGALRIADRNPMLGFHPPYNGGIIDRLLHTCLLVVGHDNELVPDLATVVPTQGNGLISKDGRTIDYRLRRDARWEDGVAMTADDVIFTWRAIVDKRNNYQFRFPYTDVRSIEKLDRSALRVHLAQPNSSFVPKFFAENWCLDVLPAHVYAKYGSFDKVPHSVRPIGSGPYVLDRWERNDRVVLRANPTYFRGTPHIARIDDVFVSETNTVINEMQTGELDADFDASPREAVALRNDSKLRIVLTPQPVVGTLFFNCADPVTGDKRLRRAIAYALDRPAIANAISYGYFDAREPARQPFDFAYDPTVPQPKLDLARANALFDAAGWKRGPDGRRQRDGKRLELLMVTSQNGIDPRVAVFVQSQLQHVGVSVEIKTYDVHVLYAPASEGGIIRAARFQIWYNTYNFQGDYGDLHGELACDQKMPFGLNVFRLCDPRLDAVNKAALLTYDTAKRKALYARAQRYLYDDMPWVLLYTEPKIDIISKRLQDFVGIPGPLSFFRAYDWRIAASPDAVAHR